MKSVLSAESAVLVHLESVGRILFVFHCVVVALLALSACKSDLNSHNGTSIFNVSLPLIKRQLRSAVKPGTKKRPFFRGTTSVSQKGPGVKRIFKLAVNNYIRGRGPGRVSIQYPVSSGQ